MTPLLRMQNAETIDRLVIQGEFLLKTFHAEYERAAQGARPSFCVATSRAGAIPCTLCTTMALKRSLIALLPRHASPFPIAELEAFGSLVCTTRISESRMRNRWLRNQGDFSTPQKDAG